MNDVTLFTDRYPLIDGFLYNTRLRPNMTMLAMSLDRYEPLRRAGAYRVRCFTIPNNTQVTQVPARDAYEYQKECIPGTVIWGWTFVAGTPGNYSIIVTDGCTDVALQSEVLSMKNSQGQKINPGQGKQNLLPDLLVIGEPGLLNVQICNLSGAATGVQLILWGAMPVPEQCEAA